MPACCRAGLRHATAGRVSQPRSGPVTPWSVLSRRGARRCRGSRIASARGLGRGFVGGPNAVGGVRRARGSGWPAAGRWWLFAVTTAFVWPLLSAGTLAVVGACSSRPSGEASSSASPTSSVRVDQCPGLPARLPTGAERVSTRYENLGGKHVAIERLKVDCARRSDGVLMPQVEQPSSAKALPAWLPNDCAEEVERIWGQRFGSPHLLGAYPVRGVQLTTSHVVRRFSSVVRIVGRPNRRADLPSTFGSPRATRPAAFAPPARTGRLHEASAVRSWAVVSAARLRAPITAVAGQCRAKRS